jgi:hypothetical protein
VWEADPGSADPTLRTESELAAMTYGDAVSWAHLNFDRMVDVAIARNYYPGWIYHYFRDHGTQLAATESMRLQAMMADAGPILTPRQPRQRWVLKQVKDKPTTIESMAKLVNRAAEYREFRKPVICMENDVTWRRFYS